MKYRLSMAIANPVGWRTPNLIGGGEIVVKSLIERLTKAKAINILQLSPIFKPAKNNSIKVNTIKPLFIKTQNPIFDIIQTIWWILKATIYLYKLKNDTDIYYSSTTNITDFIPHLVASKLTSKPLVVKCQITIYHGNSKYKFINIYNNYRDEKNHFFDSIIRAISSTMVLELLPLCDKVICLSKEVETSLLSTGISSKKLIINQIGININKLFKYNNSQKNIDLCYMSRIETYKGIFDFLKLCVDMSKENNHLKAVIIGDGSKLEETRRYIEKAGLKKNVLLKGFLGESRYEYLGKSKLFVLPSTAKEGFGLAIPEAIACGATVLLYENPVFRSVFNSLKTVHFFQSYKQLRDGTAIFLRKTSNPTKNTDHNKKEAIKFNITKSITNEENIIINVINSRKAT